MWANRLRAAFRTAPVTAMAKASSGAKMGTCGKLPYFAADMTNFGHMSPIYTVG